MTILLLGKYAQLENQIKLIAQYNYNRLSNYKAMKNQNNDQTKTKQPIRANQERR